MTSEERFQKIESALRDLIVVSRTLVDSQQSFEETLRAMADAQKQANEDFNVKFNALLQAQMETEHKLQRWIDRHGNA